MKHITEMEGGWWVRFWRSGRNPSHQKYFADSVYGDSEKALAAAQQWRDEMLKELPDPKTYNPEGLYLDYLRKDNQSGVTGVSLVHRKSGKVCWQAQWHETVNGERKHKTKNFHFETPAQSERAFDDAVAFRKEMEALHYHGKKKRRKA